MPIMWKAVLLGLILVQSALAFDVPDVGPGVCVPAPGYPCDLPSQSYDSSSSDSSSSYIVPSSSGVSEPYYSYDPSKPCQHPWISHCISICRSQPTKSMIKSCLESCVMKNSQATSAFIQCVRMVQARAVSSPQQSASKILSSPKPAAMVQPPPDRLKVEEPEEEFDFDIIVSPDVRRVTAGEQASFNVEVRKRAGKARPVSLTIGGQGIFDFVGKQRGDWSFAGKKEFERAPDPSFTTTLVLSTTEGSIPGEYSMAVRGIGGNYRKSGDFELFIEPIQNPAGPRWEVISSKLRRAGATLSKEDFLVYLKKLEEANPGLGWRGIVSQMDTGRGGVDMLGLNIPGYVIDPVGETISVQSSATSLHSDFEKPGFLKGLSDSWNSFWKSGKEQKQGESMGRWMADYFKTPGNEDKRLSDAYNEYFSSYGLQSMQPNPNPFAQQGFIPKPAAR